MIQALPIGSLVKRILIGCMMLCFVADLSAQARHFSDFRMSPTWLNPGLTGGFQGTYRINGIYRSQWGSLSNSNPYKTFVGSADVNLKGDLLLDNDWLAIGLSFSNDQAGISSYKQSIIATNVAYHLGLDDDYKNVISLGVSYGKISTSLGRGYTLYTGLSEDFNDDYDRLDYTAPCDLPGCSNSSGQGQPKSTDIAVGFTYKTELNSGAIVKLGLSMNHINQPEAAIATGRGDTMITGPFPPDPDIGRKVDPLGRNLIFYGEGSALLSPRVRLNPAFLFMTASGHTQMQIQSTADYLLNAKKQTTLIGGLGLRVIPTDAAYLMAGIRIKDLTVRLTYDINISSFSPFERPNTFEMSVGYIGRIYRQPSIKQVIFCPRL